MNEKELTQEELNALAQEAVKANEARAEAAGEKAEEAPPSPRLVIEFVAPGHASFKSLVADGFVTPDQMASAGLQLINQAMSIWNVGFVEMIVRRTIEEFFRQQKEAIEEEQVRRILRTGRGRPS